MQQKWYVSLFLLEDIHSHIMAQLETILTSTMIISSMG